MVSSRKQEIGVGVLVLVAFGLLAFMSIKVGALRNVGQELEVQVLLSDAAGLSDGAAVRIAGVQVGQIQQMDVEHDQARITMAIAKSAGVRDDVKIQVRARSILGEKYLEITPVSKDAPLLAEGATLEVTSPQTEIDELVNSLGPLIRAIDADAVNVAMGRLTAALEDDPDRVVRMFRDVETILSNSAKASGSLEGLMSETRSTLSSVRQISAESRPMIQRSSAIVTKVDTATDKLPQITEDIQVAVSDTRKMIADSHKLIQRLESSAETLETIFENLSEIDRWELRRLLREEGILVRFKENEVKEPE
jgi:phospholipid/cholesterol/gamma-HCH transport system substrate-binding protein